MSSRRVGNRQRFVTHSIGADVRTTDSVRTIFLNAVFTITGIFPIRQINLQVTELSNLASTSHLYREWWGRHDDSCIQRYR